MSNKQPNKTQRLDAQVLELGLVPSRKLAQSAIMAGAVLVDGQKVTKPGTPIAKSAKIELLSGWGRPKFVSRGGLKLQKALDEFGIDPSGRVCLDVGASTGGFTDCLLQAGARQVYAVDVGYGQLDWGLRNDPRVVIKERLNARYLTPELLYPPGSSRASLGVVDVSFISLSKVLPNILSVMAGPLCEIVCLIKPQFEAGRLEVGKKGVVRSAQTQAAIIEKVVASCWQSGLFACGLTYSPVKGPAGNIEYLVHLRPGSSPAAIDVYELVYEAHRILNT